MPRKPVVGAIIQARTGSSRLPGKVFRELAGQPILFHILERLSRCKTIDKVVIATTTLPEDEKIIQFADDRNVLSFAGEEDDVQKRFIDAASKHGIKVVVRICSDSPFIDPVMIDRLVKALIDERCNYAIPDPRIRSAQEGFEVVSLRAIVQSRKLSSQAQHREHVTLYIRQNPKKFRVLYLKPKPALVGRFRLSVDTVADLEFAQAVYGALYRSGKIVDLREMVAYLKKTPAVYKTNAHIKQKATNAVSLRVGFLVPKKADPKDKGLLAGIESLARVLNEHYHCGIAVISDEKFHKERFQTLGFRIGQAGKDPKSVIRALKENKVNYVVSCGVLGDKINKALEENGYPILSLIGKKERVIKAVVTGGRKNAMSRGRNFVF